MEDIVNTVNNWDEIIADKDAQIKQLKLRLEELEALTKYYEEQLRLAKHRQFGRSSEKTEEISEQLGLFDEVENTADPKQPEPDFETITYTRRKRTGKRKDDFSSLPVETVNTLFLRGKRYALNAAGLCMSWAMRYVES